jgi:IS4 transposase
MVWAEYGVGPKGEANGVRLHLRFNLVTGKPQDAKVQRGKSCERQALRQMCVAGQINVADRYYGEDYKLFKDVEQAGGYFVFRLKESAVINAQQELALAEEDRAAGVVRHVWATLGATEVTRSIRVRVVEIRVQDQHLLLVTNLPLEQASAALVGLIYRKRWDIELFFRWIKCILGCRHFFAESPEGVAIQLYLALIASLLFQYYSGRRPNKRTMELIQFYLMGWATTEDLIRLLEKQVGKQTSDKKT